LGEKPWGSACSPRMLGHLPQGHRFESGVYRLQSQWLNGNDRCSSRGSASTAGRIGIHEPTRSGPERRVDKCLIMPLRLKVLIGALYVFATHRNAPSPALLSRVRSNSACFGAQHIFFPEPDRWVWPATSEQRGSGLVFLLELLQSYIYRLWWVCAVRVCFAFAFRGAPCSIQL